MEVQFVLDKSVNSRLPTSATAGSAALDFYAAENVTVPGFGRCAVATGVTVSWDHEDAYLQLFSRSGLFNNFGITCEAGVIDIDFNLPISVLLQNHTPDSYRVKEGDRIAQGIFLWKVPIRTYYHVTSEIGMATDTEPICHQIFTYDPHLGQVRVGGLGSTGR